MSGSYIPLDVLRVLLDLLPPSSRGKTILASSEILSAFVGDSQFWDRIWSEMGFYMSPQDRSPGSRPLPSALSRCSRAYSALSRPNSCEHLQFRKVIGIPSWLPAPNGSCYGMESTFCAKQPGFDFKITKRLPDGRYSVRTVVEELCVDVSNIREVKDLQRLPFHPTSALKECQELENAVVQRSGKILDGAFVLRRARRIPRRVTSQLFRLDPESPGKSLGLVRGFPEKVTAVPPGRQRVEFHDEPDYVSCSPTSLHLLLDIYGASYLKENGARFTFRASGLVFR